MSWDLPAMLTILSCIGVRMMTMPRLNKLEFSSRQRYGLYRMVGERYARGSCGKSERQTFGTEPGDGRDQGTLLLNVGLHAYFCRTAYNMGIDLLPTTTTSFSILRIYGRHNLTSAEDVEMPSNLTITLNTVGMRRCRPTVRGVPVRDGNPLQPLCQGERYECSISQAFAEKERPEGYGERYCRSWWIWGLNIIVY